MSDKSPVSGPGSGPPSCNIGKEATEPDMEQQTGSQLRKECVKTVYFHPAYLTSVKSTSCEIPGWMKLKLESKFPGAS